MKVLLVAINAKYIHSNLAVHSLKKYALHELSKHGISMERIQIEIAEYTINMKMDTMLGNIYKKKPEVLAFSCYIWNIAIVKEMLKEYKKIDNNIKIWIGGPEVSYHVKEVLYELPEVTGIVIGEGEQTFFEVLSSYLDPQKSLLDIEGIAFFEELKKSEKTTENGRNIYINQKRELLNFSKLPFIYEEMSKLNVDFYEFEHRIVYYESSRGCPFSCSYCLSSIDKKVRFRDKNLVYKELLFFINHKVPQVKFVDRTFNANASHAIDIWNFIKEHDNKITNFHFEIAADLVTKEQLELLSTMRKGLIQLEIGIQSTNPLTIQAINRTMNLGQVSYTVEEIRKFNNIHQHLDLIVGLPYEDYTSFQSSFNDVYHMRPNQLQLGFLKVLKGSPIEKQIKEYEIAYQSKTPYEVLYTKWISYEEILRLKAVEEMVEVYYNSGQFKYVMMFLEHFFADPFTMYEMLAEYYEKNKLDQINHARIKRYEIVQNFFIEFISKQYEEKQEIKTQNLVNQNTRIKSIKINNIKIENTKEEIILAFSELMVYDLYLRENVKNRPIFATSMEQYKKEIKSLVNTKKIELKDSIHVEHFTIDIESTANCGQIMKKESFVLFEYGKRDPFYKDAFVSELLIEDVLD